MSCFDLDKNAVDLNRTYTFYSRMYILSRGGGGGVYGETMFHGDIG